MKNEVYNKILKMHELAREIQTQMPNPEDCESDENELYDSIIDFIYAFGNYNQDNKLQEIESNNKE